MLHTTIISSAERERERKQDNNHHYVFAYDLKDRGWKAQSQNSCKLHADFDDQTSRIFAGSSRKLFRAGFESTSSAPIMQPGLSGIYKRSTQQSIATTKRLVSSNFNCKSYQSSTGELQRRYQSTLGYIRTPTVGEGMKLICYMDTHCATTCDRSLWKRSWFLLDCWMNLGTAARQKF